MEEQKLEVLVVPVAAGQGEQGSVKGEGVCVCCGAEGGMVQCPMCFSVTYCSKACRRHDWAEGHKNVCARLAKGYIQEKSKSAWLGYNKGLYMISVREMQNAIRAQDERDERAMDQVLAESLRSLGTFLCAAGKYNDALVELEDALRGFHRLFGKQNAGYASTLMGIGTVYRYQGKYTMAQETLTEALQIQEHCCGHETSCVAATLAEIAMVDRKQGHYQQALEGYEESLRITRLDARSDQGGRGGRGHCRDRDEASTLSDMAILHREQGLHKEALEEYEASLRIRTRLFGKRHPAVAQILNNMANVYLQLGKHPDALHALLTSLEISKKILGDAHPQVAQTLNNVAVVYEKQGRLNLALRHYEQALTIIRATHGDEHALYAQCINNVSSVFLEQGRLLEALEGYEEALRIKKKRLGGEHPSVARTISNIGVVCQRQGRHDDALENHAEALRILTAALGDKHPDVGRAHAAMGVAHLGLGEYAAALAELDSGLEIACGAAGEESAAAANVLFNIALVYDSQGDAPKARDIFRACARIYTQAYGGAHRRTVEAVRRAGRRPVSGGEVAE